MKPPFPDRTVVFLKTSRKPSPNSRILYIKSLRGVFSFQIISLSRFLSAPAT
ncbi:MAG: hypothetical protein QGH50_20875 [SAR324 cluster bacterium]|nr:hypothetical protein [SAR324 cluster bacterium]